MSIKVEKVTGQNSDDYQQFIITCPTAVVQHTWEWGQVISSIGQDQSCYLLARDETGCTIGALPAFVYHGELGSLMISVPQAGGYGGVVIHDRTRKDLIAHALLSTLLEEARLQGCVLTTISTPPFFGDRNLYRRYLKPDFELENFYQYLDLGRDETLDFSTRKRRSIRRTVNTAKEYGLRVSFDDSEDRFEQWYDIHRKRMAELETMPLPHSLFKGARKYLFKNKLGFFGYVLDKDKVVGGALFIGLNEILDIFLMSSDSDYFDQQPNNLLIFESLNHARDAGYRYFNWQSCSSRQSGVYHYKRRWGSREGVHHYMTKITGDISRLRNSALEVIKEKYRWHYVIPYEQFRTAKVENA